MSLGYRGVVWAWSVLQLNRVLGWVDGQHGPDTSLELDAVAYCERAIVVSVGHGPFGRAGSPDFGVLEQSLHDRSR